jgi:ankyrin repeat protein
VNNYPAAVCRHLVTPAAAKISSRPGGPRGRGTAKLPLLHLLGASMERDHHWHTLLRTLLDLAPEAVTPSADPAVDRETALMCAVSRLAHNSIDVVALILSYSPAAMSCIDPRTLENPLHRVLKQPYSAPDAASSLRHRANDSLGPLVQLLASITAVSQRYGQNNSSVLHLAAESGYPLDTLRHLAALGDMNASMRDNDSSSTASPGSSLHQPNAQGNWPLHCVLLHGPGVNCACVEELWRQCPKAIEQPNSRGQLPLHIAMKSCLPEAVVCFLLSKCPAAATRKCHNSHLPFCTGLASRAPIASMKAVLRAHPAAAVQPVAMYSSGFQGDFSNHRFSTVVHLMMMTTASASDNAPHFLADLIDKEVATTAAQGTRPHAAQCTSTTIKGGDNTTICSKTYVTRSTETLAAAAAAAASGLTLGRTTSTIRADAECSNEEIFRAEKSLEPTLLEQVVKCWTEAHTALSNTSLQFKALHSPPRESATDAYNLVHHYSAKSTAAEPSLWCYYDAKSVSFCRDGFGDVCVFEGGGQLLGKLSVLRFDEEAKRVICLGNPAVGSDEHRRGVLGSCQFEVLEEHGGTSFAHVAKQLGQMFVAKGGRNVLLQGCGRDEQNPLHVLLANWRAKYSPAILRYVLALGRRAVASRTADGSTALSILLNKYAQIVNMDNKELCAEAVKVIADAYPAAVRVRPTQGSDNIPLVTMLENRNDMASAEVVRHLISLWPASARISVKYGSPQGNFEGLPLHLAILCRCSAQVCEIIRSAHPAALHARFALKVESGWEMVRPRTATAGYTVFHAACAPINMYWVKDKSPSAVLLRWLCSLDSALLAQEAADGSSALSVMLMNRNTREHSTPAMRLAIETFPAMVRRTVPFQRSGDSTPRRLLPLHVAIERCLPAACVECVCSYYPEAVAQPVPQADGHSSSADGVRAIFPLESAMSRGAISGVLQVLCKTYQRAVFLPGCRHAYMLHAAMAHRCELAVIETFLQAKDARVLGEAQTHRLGPATGVGVQETTVSGVFAASQPDDKGRLPLHIGLGSQAQWKCIQACWRAYPDALKVADAEGRLPVHIALGRGYDSACTLELATATAALTGGVAVDRQYERTLVHWAATMESYDLEFVEAVMELDRLKGGACFRTPDKSGQLPLHHWLQRRAIDSKEEVTKIVAFHPSAVAIADAKGRLPLHWAAGRNDGRGDVAEGIATEILEAFPAAAHMVDDDGCLPLHYAVRTDKAVAAVVQLLLHRHPDGVRAPDQEGLVPLFHAMLQQQPEPVLELLRPNSPAVSRDSTPKKLRVRLALAPLKTREDDKRWDEEQTEYEVDRSDLFASVLQEVAQKDSEELQYTPKIVYEAEEGDDYGGLSRDFFREWTDRMSESPMWRLTASGQSIIPEATEVCAMSVVDEATRAGIFNTCGKVCALALLHGCAWLLLLLLLPPDSSSLWLLLHSLGPALHASSWAAPSRCLSVCVRMSV